MRLRAVLGGDGALRQRHDQRLRGAVAGDLVRRVELDGGVLPVGDDLVVEPAELELLPRAHVARRGADRVLAAVEPGAAAHQGPEGGAVVAARGVVEVGQAEVVAELVREDAEAAVLRLGGVVADPDAGVADLGAAGLVVARTRRADAVGVGVPAVRPDRVGALGAAAGLLALTGVDGLEVVDVAVGLVEVAVAVVVVAVDLVEALEVVDDLGVGLALRLLVVVPGLAGVADERPVRRGRANLLEP